MDNVASTLSSADVDTLIQPEGDAIANAPTSAVSAGTLIFFAAFDGTDNGADNLTDGSQNPQTTAVRELEQQAAVSSNLLPNYYTGPGTPGTLSGSDGTNPLHVTPEAINTAQSAYNDFAREAAAWLMRNPNGLITSMIVSFSRGAAAAAIFSQLLYENGLVEAGKTLVSPGQLGAISAALIIDPVLTEVGGNLDFPNTVANLTEVEAQDETRSLYRVADYQDPNVHVYPVRGNHGDAGDFYDNGLGGIYLQAYTQFFENAGAPLNPVPATRAYVQGTTASIHTEVGQDHIYDNPPFVDPPGARQTSPAGTPVTAVGSATIFTDYKGDLVVGGRGYDAVGNAGALYLLPNSMASGSLAFSTIYIDTNSEFAIDDATGAVDEVVLSKNSTLSLSVLPSVVGIISSFTPGNAIDIGGIGTASAAFVTTGDILAVVGGSTSPVDLQLDPTQNYDDTTFITLPDGMGGTYVEAQVPGSTVNTFFVSSALNGFFGPYAHVTAGETFTISALGDINVGSLPYGINADQTPSGQPGLTVGSGAVEAADQSLPLFSLIGAVNNSAPFEIGSGGTFSSNSDGYLYLAFNALSVTTFANLGLFQVPTENQFIYGPSSFGYAGTSGDWIINISVVPPKITPGMTISSGDIENVPPSTIVSGDIVKNDGMENISSGGVVISTTVSSGGTETVSAGGVASGSVIANGGFQDLLNGLDEFSYDGGTAYGTVISSGGSQIVGSGTYSYSGSRTFTAVASNTVVGFGGYELVSNGAKTISSVISNGGTEVLDGGIAIGTDVSGGGVISGGGYTTGTHVESGGLEANAGFSSGSIIDSGGTEVAPQTWTTYGTELNSGGYEIVRGTASGTDIQNGAVEIVKEGGKAIDTTVEGGGVLLAEPYSFISNTSVTPGGLVVSTGAIVLSGTIPVEMATPSLDGALVSDNETEYVLSGATADNTTVESGGQNIIFFSGSANGTVVDGGGYEILSGYGSISTDTTVNGGGYEFVRAGSAVGTVVNSGGYEVVSGGSAVDAVVNSGGLLFIAGGFVDGAIDVTVEPGGTETASGVIIDSGSIPILVTAGELVGATISAGETDYTVEDGSATNSIIEAGGYEHISFGGLSTDAVIDYGGNQVNFGNTTGTVISNGGTEVVLDMATGTDVKNGGYEIVSYGGRTISSIVENGGYEVVSGAHAISTTVEAGGHLVLSAALVEADDGTIPYVPPDVEGLVLEAGGIVDLTYIRFSQTNSVELDPTTDLLTMDVGGATYYEELAGDYSNATFSLSAAGPLPNSTLLTLSYSDTVIGAQAQVLTVNFANGSTSAQLQPEFTAISEAIVAGTLIAEEASDAPLPTLPAEETGLVEIDTSVTVVLQTGYDTVIDLATGPVSVIAATSENHLIVGSGDGDLLYAAVAGIDTISAATGSSTIFGAAASIDFFGGSGASTVIGGTGGNTIFGGDGEQLIFGTSSLQYYGGSGAATIIGGGGGNTVTGGVGNLLVFASSSMTYVGTVGAATLIGGGGPLDAYLGSGGGIAYGSPDGNDTLASGNGTSILVGGGDGDVLIATGTTNDTLVAGAGAETLSGSGSTGNLVLFGGPGSDMLAGGTGGNLFIAESGNETIAGGGTSDSYVFINTPGTTRTDVVVGFNPNVDAIGLFGFGAEPAADAAALAAATAAYGDTIVTLTDGTSIAFVGAPTLNTYNFF